MSGIKKDKDEIYKEQKKIAVIGILAEIPNFILILISAIVTGTLVIWLDFFDSFCNVSRESFVTGFSLKMEKNSVKYTRDSVRRMEERSSLVIDIVMIAGVLASMAVAVFEIADPSPVSSSLFWVLLLKIVNVSFDAFFVIRQTGILKKDRSDFIISEFESYLKNLAFDGAVLVAVLLSVVFRSSEVSPYFSPVFTLVIAVFVIIRVIGRRIRKKHEPEA